MKYYEAIIISRGKKTTHGFMAVDKKEAMLVAQSAGMVIGVKEAPMPFAMRFELFKERVVSRFFVSAIGMQELVVVMRQMGVMLGAGISLNDALSEAAASTQDKRLKEIVVRAQEDVEAGLSLSESIGKHGDAVGTITMAMLTLGEKTGTLSESLLKLAELLEELRDNRAKIKKAMRTPTISLVAMIVAFVVLIMLVVPKFKSVFSRLGADLPPPTQILIAIEYGFSNYGHFMLAGIFVAIFAHSWAMKKRVDYRLYVDRLTLRLYLVGSMSSYGFFGRFMLIFSELIRSGIPLTEAMATAAGTIENTYVKGLLEDAVKSIEQGKQLSTVLDETALFEPMVLQMIRSGESSGELDAMLARVADYYKMRFNHLIDNFSALLEPILMAFIAALVLLIALGIFLPMWDISSAAMKK